MRGGSYPLDWEAQPMRPPSTGFLNLCCFLFLPFFFFACPGRPGTTSRPSTAGGFEARDAPVESARRMSRPSTANGAGLFTQSAREPQYQVSLAVGSILFLISGRPGARHCGFWDLWWGQNRHNQFACRLLPLQTLCCEGELQPADRGEICEIGAGGKNGPGTGAAGKDAERTGNES